MAKLHMTSENLLASIKLRAAVPLAQISFEDEDLLNFATEEIALKIVPNILAVREEFYITTETIPLVSNQSNYKIPYRAIGGKLRFVFLERSDGTFRPLAQLPMEMIPEYQASSFAYQEAGFYVQGDEIVVLPPISGAVTGNLIMKYYLKPNKVVLLDRGAQVVGINTLTGEIQVSSIPDNITPGSEIDFIQSKPNNSTLNFDVIAASVNTGTNTITVALDDLPSNLEVGDYICSAGESVIPQVPEELQVMVAQAVACRVMEAIGDTQGLANASAKLADMEAKLLNIIDNRVEAPGRKVVNNNSFLKSRRYIRRWFY